MIKSLLISTLLAGSALSVQAKDVKISAQPVSMEKSGSIQSLKVDDLKVVSSKKLSKGVVLQTVKDANGVLSKRLVTNRSGKIAVSGNKSFKAEEASAIVLSEDFESCDGAATWQPEGWSVQSVAVEGGEAEPASWAVSVRKSSYEPVPNGTYYEYIQFQTGAKDEWLITPAVTLPAYPSLYYNAYVDPIFLFDLNCVDWDAFVFTEVRPSANLQVLVKAEGDAEWTTIKDYFDEYKAYSLSELFDMSPDALEKQAIDLAAYAGKKVQVAFRYVGADGNTMYIDDVMLSNPCLEAKYSFPLGALYFGIAKDFSGLTLSMPVYPVGQELVWYNMTEESGITSQWQYHDWATNEILTTNDQDLTAIYYPDYSNDFTCRNNCYNSPILTVSKEGAAPGSYSLYDYFQAGGRAEWSISGEIKSYGMFPFDFNTEGFDFVVADNDMGVGIPIYGYSSDVDKYWTDYTFGGEEGEGEGVKMVAIMNYYFPQEKPIVFSNAWVSAKGQIGENAEFKLEVIPLSDEGTLTEAIATATCKGSEMIMTEGGGNQNYYTIPFTFAAPVVMSSDVCMSYVIRLSGFNDAANVTYFAPYQSVTANPDGYALGWIEKEISMGGETRSSLSPQATYTDYTSFAIAIDGAYPWLYTSKEEVAISEEGVQEVSLGSYYDGSELTATQADGSALPEWLNVALSGRYGDSKAVFTASGDQAGVCVVKISAAGVEAIIKVTYDGSASAEMVVSDSENAASQMYNLNGQKVAGNPAAGIYIIRKANGEVSKKVIR